MLKVLKMTCLSINEFLFLLLYIFQYYPNSQCLLSSVFCTICTTKWNNLSILEIIFKSKTLIFA